METLRLKILDTNNKVFELLEEKLLLKRFVSSLPTATNLPKGDIFGKTIYQTTEELGTHKLIFIESNNNDVELAYHEDNEDFLLIDSSGKQEVKPLFLIVGLCKVEKLRHRIEKGILTVDDFLCIKLKFNDPQLSFFTMFAHTPHCELTTLEDGLNPSFFVTEPSKLKDIMVDTGNYKLNVEF